MSNILPHPCTRAKLSGVCSETGRFAHIYDAGDGTYRIRFGTGIQQGKVFAGMKLDDTQKMLDAWLSDATPHDMHELAYKGGAA